VHVQGLVRRFQGTVQVAVLDPVAAAAVEVAGAAGVAAALADTLGDLARSTALTILPEPGGISISRVGGLPAIPAGFLYLPVVSWQARQSTFSWEVKSKLSSCQP